MSYKHLSITERELIAIYRAKNWSICKIAALFERNKATISRELARNGDYLPSKAQARYKRRRKKCRPHKLLEKPELFNLVKKLFLECQLSPEQKRSTGNKGAIRKLRHRGKPRRKKGYVSNRGKIPITNELSARPIEANERSRFGDCEADTIIGYKTAMIEALRGQPLHTRTPTACCASIFRKVTTSTRSSTSSYRRSLTNLIRDRENVWVIEHRGKYTFPLCCT